MDFLKSKKWIINGIKQLYEVCYNFICHLIVILTKRTFVLALGLV